MKRHLAWALALLLLPAAPLTGRDDDESPYEQILEEADRNPRIPPSVEGSLKIYRSDAPQVLDDFLDNFNPATEVAPIDSIAAAERRANQQALAQTALRGEDASSRRQAVKDLTDPALLADIARSAPDSAVRLAATKKLTDPLALAEVAGHDTDPNVRHAAATRLKEQQEVAYSPEVLYYSRATLQILRTGAVEVKDLPTQPPATSDEEDLLSLVEEFSSPTLSEAVAQRLKDDERVRFLAPYRDAGVSAGSPLDPATIIEQNKAVQRIRKTWLIRIGYTHPDPDMAAMIANLYADECIAHDVRRAIGAAMSAVEDLRARADRHRTKIKALRDELAAYDTQAKTAPLTPEQKAAKQKLEQGLEVQEAILSNCLERLQAEKNALSLDGTGFPPRMVEKAVPSSTPVQPFSQEMPSPAPAVTPPDTTSRPDTP